ncbi:hypothetical protein ES708_12092 [subsurface metagenome]
MDEIWKVACDVKSEVLAIEPKIDLLHDVLGFGRFAEVTQTADGFFLGRRAGDIGFDVFLGKPSEVAKERTGELFKKLSGCSQEQVKALLRARNINTRDIGIKA